MKTKLSISSLLILLSASLLFAGCAPVPGEVPIGAEANGTRVELELGQVLVISLESNPTTGFGWHVAAIDAAVLKQVGEVEFVQEPADEPLVGSGGTEVLRFEAVGSGTATLTLTYDRAWEDIAPEASFTVTVVVP